ncbi:MAG: cation diffusion facilitator family transporter [Hyphomicrobiaceae bacterium]
MSTKHHHHGPAGHHHGHTHHHAPGDFGRAFAIGTALNIGFVILEAVYGILAGSMALLADAGHNLSDVLGLLVAWGAVALGRRAPSRRFTYGLRSSSILAALTNAILLLLAVGAIAWEAVRRLAEPEPVAALPVIVVAGIGIVINAVTAWLFRLGGKADINIRGAYLHMAADALVSLGVVVAGVLILWTGWLWIDPLASLTIAAIIVWGTWSLLRQSTNMALQGVPDGIDPATVRNYLLGLPGVASVHDLHIWPMSTTETALTCHMRMPSGHPGDGFLRELGHALDHRFAIRHATVQIETSEAGECALEPEDVV